MKKNKVIIVGAFVEIVELCEVMDVEIVGIFDNILSGSFMGYKILGNDKSALDNFKMYSKIPIIVTPDKPETREKIINNYRNVGYKFLNVFHNNTTISKSAKIGEGVVIQNGVNISANVIIGDFVKINTYANIMHDSVIGKFSTIAPNSVILGRVIIGDNCYIGANSTILPSVSIENNAVVGAGAVVTKNVVKGTTVKGVPARD